MTRHRVFLARRKCQRPVHYGKNLIPLARVAVATWLISLLLIGCGADSDDSGRGGPAVEAVTSISSSAGDLWLGAPPTLTAINADVLAAAARGVAAVRAQGCGSLSNGTAFAVAPGLLAGAAHVVAGASVVEIEWFPNGAEQGSLYNATVVGFDEGRDLALLRTEAPVTPLEIDRARLGATAVVLGYAEGGGLVASPARVEHFVRATGLWGDGAVRSVYVLSADVRAGQSGAPLVDSRGHVAGVTFGTVRGSQQVGFALSRGELLNFLSLSGVEARVDHRGRAVISMPDSELVEVPNGECPRS